MEGRRIFLTTDAVGGVWRYSLDLARGYSGNGLCVDLVIVGPRASSDRLAEAEGIPGVEVMFPDLPLDWMAEDEADATASAHELAALAQRRKADVVHLNAAGLGGGGSWPAPLVITLHSCVATWWRAVRGDQPLPPDLAWRRDLVAAALAEADAVIVPSRSFATAAREVYPDMARPTVVHNGQHPTAEPELAAARSDTAFTCGRLWDQAKNAAAVDAAAGLLDTVISAAGPVANPLGGEIALPNLRLLGELSSSAVRQQMRSSGVYVSAAIYEPFGLSVLEAAQAGSALVLSDIPTFRELWDGAARFVSPDSPEQIARAIDALAASPQTRTQLGRRAQRRAGRYGSAGMTSGTLSVYERVLRHPILAGRMA